MRVRTDTYDVTDEERRDIACAMDNHGRMATHAELRDWLWSHGAQALSENSWTNCDICNPWPEVK